MRAAQVSTYALLSPAVSKGRLLQNETAVEVGERGAGKEKLQTEKLQESHR